MPTLSSSPPPQSLSRGLASPRVEQTTARRRQLGTTLSISSWNVCSVVESDGPVRAAAVRGIVSDDKKIFQIVGHLDNVCVLCSGGGRLYFSGLLFLASVRACSRRCGRPGVSPAVQANSA